MSCRAYVEKKFNSSSVKLIAFMTLVIDEYRAQGFVLTVRQLYYQLVARDVISNNLKEYKRIAGLLNDARLAGLVDWDAIEDRTREFIRRPRWESGGVLLQTCADQFHKDLWQDQETRPYVLVEKEALTGVLAGICREYDIPLLAARGYPSVSVIREFVEFDLRKWVKNEGQSILILHFGDHDPSGIDMTRDLEERISLFAGRESRGIEIRRVALNMDQIEEQQPPENPAKTTDSRFESYLRNFGSSSWELDALSPSYLANLVRAHIDPIIDRDFWNTKLEEIESIKERLRDTAASFDDQ